mgnify:CR=1 FL=1
MTPRQGDNDPALLRQRLAVVAAISLVNARQLRNWQVRGGAEIEASYLEQVIAGDGGSDTHLAALVEVRSRLQEVEVVMRQCDEELATLNARLAALDHLVSGE